MLVEAYVDISCADFLSSYSIVLENVFPFSSVIIELISFIFLSIMLVI